MTKKAKRNLILSLITGLTLAFAWPIKGLQVFVFVSLIPLLVLFEKLAKDETALWKVYLNFFISFFTWNLLCTWWVLNASLVGAILAIVLNSAFMALVVLLAYWVRRKRGLVRGVTCLILFWLSFEFIHYRWELIWPWLNLGNIFAPHPEWVQWYSYTGVLGGSLWIWLQNLGIWLMFRSMFTEQRFLMSKGAYMMFIAIVPLLFSWIVSVKVKPYEGDKIGVVVVQPNIDAYTEKYSTSPKRQIKKFTDLADRKMDSTISLVVGPETMIPTGLWQHQLGNSGLVQDLNDWRTKWPNTALLVGATTYLKYYGDDQPSPSARLQTQHNFWYDVYNTALYFGKTNTLGMYHKSKLVPGVEQMPYDNLLKPLKSLAMDLGGSSGTLGIQKEAEVFESMDGSYNIGPAICYESVCGEHMAQFVKKGANIIAIITNDDWWGKTPGFKQHFEYSRLRAIESRRWVVRSANTGTSGVVDPLGRKFRKTKYKFDAVFRHKVYKREDITFYVKHGDWIGRYAAYFSLFFIASTIVKGFRRKA